MDIKRPPVLCEVHGIDLNAMGGFRAGEDMIVDLRKLTQEAADANTCLLIIGA